MTIRICAILLFFLSIQLIACTSGDGHADYYSPSESDIDVLSSDSTPSAPAKKKSTKTKKISIRDKTLKMPIVSMRLPEGLDVHHNIATDLSNGFYTSYDLTIVNRAGHKATFLPDGIEFARAHDGFGGYYGEDLLSTLRHIAHSYSTYNSPGVRFEANGPKKVAITSEHQELYQMASQYRAQGSSIEMYEWAFTGPKSAGKAAFVIVDNTSQYRGVGNFTSVGAIMSGLFVEAAPSQVDQFEALVSTIDMEYNPQWLQARQQIKANVMEQMNAGHQQRMAANNASFRASQEAHKQTQAAYQASNDAWYDRNLGAGSQYNSSAAFNDAITGHTSFNDPYSGHQIKQEGHYNYWYTDGQGEYYGTDDASFDPSSLQGNWQNVQPLSPSSQY